MLNLSSLHACLYGAPDEKIIPSLCYETRPIGWNTPSDVYVSPYWKQFRAPAPILQYLLGTIYSCLMVIACIGNGIVIYIFLTSKKLRTPANTFVVGLACTDFLMMAKTPVFIYNSFHLGPLFGNLGCIIYGVIGAYSGLASAFCNAAISYDRFLVIVHPFDKARPSALKVAFCLAMIYIYVSPFALLPAFQIWSRYVPEGFLTSCAADYFMHDLNGRSYVVCTWFFGWFIPICIIIGCYIKIFVAVQKHEKELKEQAKKMNVDSLRSNRAKETRMEIQIAKTAFFVILLFLFSWIPYIVVAFLAAFSDKKDRLITPLMSMIPALTLKASACFDPFFYAISHPRYRQELQKRMSWLRIREKDDSAIENGVETASKITEAS